MDKNTILKSIIKEELDSFEVCVRESGLSEEVFLNGLVDCFYFSIKMNDLKTFKHNKSSNWVGRVLKRFIEFY